MQKQSSNNIVYGWRQSSIAHMSRRGVRLAYACLLGRLLAFVLVLTGL